ncbi:hypothetical protein ABL78_2665 [Leptomonas seymouri]|uniref:GRIP domain-containing protein n=1 Tax=Leptomonas seymouri TaxID=5684 RepID=A0A0N1PF68_LEPSE|nr:hypothetical protein ABL78_2665 [Leptomonas seymouri]|eukprot:KPI88241.1 hypothetical protein ABL78_2665 [Leptomonas seymouri]
MSRVTTVDDTEASSGSVTDGGPTDSSAPEVNQLREELQKCQEKFSMWKEKAKIGVENLRAQIIELNHRFEDSEQRGVAERHTVGRFQSSMLAQVDIVCEHSFAAASLFANSLTAQYQTAVETARAAAAPAGSLPPPPSPQDTLIGQLQRTIQGQTDRLKETQHALKKSNKEVQRRAEALQSQDEVIAVLKRRVEALESANTSLQEQLMTVPNMDEWRAALDEHHQQLEHSRLEYEKRESSLVLQHNNEIHALNAAHEEEVRELERDAQERISLAVLNALATQGQVVSPVPEQLATQRAQCQRESEDAAYMDLLSDYKAMETSSAAAVKERDVVLSQQKTLLRDLQDFFRAIGARVVENGSQVPSPPAGSTGSMCELTVDDAIRYLSEHRVRLVALEEECSRWHRELVQLKRSRPSAPLDGLGAQQTQYLRSVVVQLLCSNNNADVAKRLLPVLNVLLKFSDDDLKAVTKAMQ